jgi:N6-L-threonylcarbamoyladenine synthase
MRILAIETSCDETAICLLEAIKTPTGVEFCVINNITHTQLEHVEFGGVFPAVAKREHQINLPTILDQIMKDQEKPDVICVTNGPGLEPALWCGIVFAKELGEKWNIPVIPANHMEGHILSVLVPPLLAREGLGVRFEFQNTIQFPALALLISGGHTELVLVNDIGDYKIVGKTRDDAVGEAFDKVARMMNLPYPGGPEISKLASQFDGEKKLELPRPMIHTKDYDFSFSGLKTAVLYHVQGLGKNISEQDKQEIAHEFQNAVADVLIKKTTRAIEEFGIQTLIIGGGVAANKFIINSFQENLNRDFPHVQTLTPTQGLTGDNALMIALAGYFKHQKNPDIVYDVNSIRAVGNLSL